MVQRTIHTADKAVVAFKTGMKYDESLNLSRDMCRDLSDKFKSTLNLYKKPTILSTYNNTIQQIVNTL